MTTPKDIGAGCAGGRGWGHEASAEEFLAAGSPKLALARKLGIPFTPWLPIIAAEFPDTSTDLVPNVGLMGRNRITQDMVCEGIAINILNEESQGVSLLSNQSDYYYNVQSGIELTLDVTGQPGYPVVPDFTPLAVVTDMIGIGAYPRGWILSNQQGLKASFSARIPLVNAPIRVVVAFRMFGPVWDELVGMTNTEAVRRLREECGCDVPDAYVSCACRRG